MCPAPGSSDPAWNHLGSSVLAQVYLLRGFFIIKTSLHIIKILIFSEEGVCLINTDSELSIVFKHLNDTEKIQLFLCVSVGYFKVVITLS